MLLIRYRFFVEKAPRFFESSRLVSSDIQTDVTRLHFVASFCHDFCLQGRTTLATAIH
jgi:hypothetical protein